MASRVQVPAPLSQDMAGKEFDKWFDWNGATNLGDTCMTDVRPRKPFDGNTVLPISPLSATHSDFNSSSIHSQSLTAPAPHDLPTPSHSSDSPGARSSIDLRLSGETLRESTSSSTRSLKRKLSSGNVLAAEPQQHEPTPAAKKRPHNIIEKRYRANLNEKIAELRDSVPSLRTAKKSKAKDGSEDTDEDDLDGLTPSNKLNKASILTKAVEYIRHLEFRNRRLEDENKHLKERLVELDKVIAQGGHDSQRTTAFTSENIIEKDPSSQQVNEGESSTPQDASTSQPAKGLIPIPESWRRLRQNQSQEHYGHMYDTANKSPFRGKWPTRIMIGSLAGLMLMDGLSESDQGTDSRAKGLFGIPMELLDGWAFLRSPRLYLATFSQFCRAGGVIPLIKGFMALTILAFLIFAYLFNSKPAPKEDLEGDAVCSTQRPAPASPIEVRRRAWSTSMQVLKLPAHSFFPEWMAVTAEWLKYTVGYLFGHGAYSWLTGRSAEDDAARIKAWDIAIDAQLAGGDTEVSRSRVVLTSFGSGTLPRTPLRLMQKALHCRVLLWNVGQTGSRSYRLANSMAKFFAKREWQRARDLHDRLASRDSDRLSGNLEGLLAMECDQVFTDIVVQRAYNLMYDRPTREQSEDAMLDVVVEDYAIRSPLDAVAAWRSTSSLRKALELSWQRPSEIDLLQEHLSLALRIAPPGSATETRVFAAHALFGISDRNAYLLRASEMLQPRLSSNQDDESNLRGPFFIDSSTPASARAELEYCLHCARVLMAFERDQDTDTAQEHFSSNNVKDCEDSLLATAALRYLSLRLAGVKERNFEVGSAPCTVMARADSPWRQLNLYQQKRRESNVSHDTGYESQDDASEYWMHEEMTNSVNPYEWMA